MSGSQKLRKFVYGLGALGGSMAILTTVLEKFYGDDKENPLKRVPINQLKIRSQLKAETESCDSRGSVGDNTWSWPKWDFDWDKRSPVEKDVNNNVEVVAGGDKKVTASRHLILIRHGQYNLDGETDTERYLTDLGRHQASMTGARLAELSLPYTHILHSNMSRAVETANLISKHLPHVTMLPSDGILREGSPIRPEPRVGSWRPDHYYFTDGARIEAAFRKHFHRAEVTQTEDSYEIIVCHANVIRYFVCRALQFPPEAWLRISLKHTSLTWLTIRPDGRVSIRGLGDAGHLKPEMLTTS